MYWRILVHGGYTNYFVRMIDVGIIGGGQLGVMLMEGAEKFNLSTCVLENDVRSRHVQSYARSL